MMKNVKLIIVVLLFAQFNVRAGSFFTKIGLNVLAGASAALCGGRNGFSEWQFQETQRELAEDYHRCSENCRYSRIQLGIALQEQIGPRDKDRLFDPENESRYAQFAAEDRNRNSRDLVFNADMEYKCDQIAESASINRLESFSRNRRDLTFVQRELYPFTGAHEDILGGPIVNKLGRAVGLSKFIGKIG